MDHKQALAIYHAGSEIVVKTLCDMHAKLEEMQQRLITLEEQLAKNSRNSSKPPSSDGFKKPKPSSSEKLRKKKRKGKKRKPGGQKGHPAHILEAVSNPDYIKVHSVNKCEHCKCSLNNDTMLDYQVRQVFDVPVPKLEATEHRAEIIKCSVCGKLNQAKFPQDVTAPTQYGPRIKAAAAYMKIYQLLPYQRCGEFFRDMFSLNLSPGTLVNIVQNCSSRLESTVENIRQALIKEPVSNFDETGCSVDGKRIWLHVAGTEDLTYYEIHDKRGRKAMDDIGILPNFKGRAIHDFWKSYLSYDCQHGFCGAHLLRELIFLHEVQNQRWAEKMIDCLLDMKDAVANAKEKGAKSCNHKARKLEARYKRILRGGIVENPLPDGTLLNQMAKGKADKIKKTDAQNLLLRFRNYRKEILAFLYDFSVPFDNNIAERDVRMMKLLLKISGTFRSPDGGKHFCRIRSYISTMRKQAMNIMDAIQDVFTGTPVIPSLVTSFPKLE